MWWYLKNHITLCMVSVSSQTSTIDFGLNDLDIVSAEGIPLRHNVWVRLTGFPAYPASYKTAIGDYSSE